MPFKVGPVKHHAHMIQNISTQNADLLINDKKLSAEDFSEKHEFSMDCFTSRLRAIKGHQLVFCV